jgi:drug/metabolite transporter (DMT)-like permease
MKFLLGMFFVVAGVIIVVLHGLKILSIDASAIQLLVVAMAVVVWKLLSMEIKMS